MIQAISTITLILLWTAPACLDHLQQGSLFSFARSICSPWWLHCGGADEYWDEYGFCSCMHTFSETTGTLSSEGLLRFWDWFGVELCRLANHSYKGYCISISHLSGYTLILILYYTYTILDLGSDLSSMLSVVWLVWVSYVSSGFDSLLPSTAGKLNQHHCQLPIYSDCNNTQGQPLLHLTPTLKIQWKLSARPGKHSVKIST